MATDVERSRSSAGYAFIALAAGAAVAVALGVYGREHTPTGEAIVTFGFGGLASMKVWLSVIVGVLGVLQLTTALWMYGYLGLSAPSGLAGCYLTVMGSLVGFSAFGWLVKVSTPARLSTTAYVNPVVAVILGWALLGETLTPRALGGAWAGPTWASPCSSPTRSPSTRWGSPPATWGSPRRRTTPRWST